MGNSNSSNKISAQDKAILDMKVQRDKLHQYQKRIRVITDRETEIARECLRKENKSGALLALRRKKYQESLLQKTDQQLAQLETLTSDVEFAQVQKDVVFGLQQGTSVLKEIHKEMGGLDKVEMIMGESAEARAYQEEINDMLGGKMSNQDEDDVEDELEAMEREANALQNHVYEPIDFSAITTLNEAEPQSGAKIVQKTWMERMDQEPELNSDADEQLLMHIPFTGQIRLHSILLRTSTTSHAPMTLKLYLNREDLDFSTATSLPPTQTLELAQSNDIQEIGIKRALFNTVRSLDLFFEDNWGSGEEEVTKVSYLGFKGEWMRLSREPVNFIYEAAANPGDHKMASGVGEKLGSDVGGAGGRDGV
ncbi:DUF1000-domain-containing protein [Hortaea werneckii]|nr:DUF1000-domain-containing protein [Hortaea werneckii]KAI7208631.1 DUF1000-domain-containing protein [Hortaea werneckii]KAI7348728.1 DUF1000-domain-containing protein [Hortaea werneckii]KAI7561820.1 DUF1000-domain-containing protein [Hortaea werneckii]KAI7602424.1 DUF1000-domain-containing protein [Hortaea werneckii]